jgi:hypothetical protein
MRLAYFVYTLSQIPKYLNLAIVGKRDVGTTASFPSTASWGLEVLRYIMLGFISSCIKWTVLRG